MTSVWFREPKNPEQPLPASARARCGAEAAAGGVGAPSPRWRDALYCAGAAASQGFCSQRWSRPAPGTRLRELSTSF